MVSLPALMLSLVAGAIAATPLAPALTYLYSVNLTTQGASIGQTPLGTRGAYLHTGGTFWGPSLNGTVLFGLDWGAIDNDKVFREDTVYYLNTDDGAVIYVRAQGIGNNVHHTFETNNKKYYWLNSIIGYAAGRQGAPNGPGLDVWAVGNYS